MKRNIEKLIADYNKQIKPTNTGKFYADDLEKIREINTGSNGKVDACGMVLSALKVGFMVGYRTARKSNAGK